MGVTENLGMILGQDGPGPEAWLKIKRRTLYIYIPGVDHKTDIVTCFKAFPRVKMPEDLKIHQGLFSYAYDLWQKLKPIIQDNEIQKIELEGHSMGGGIVEILMCLLYVENSTLVLRAKVYAPAPAVNGKGVENFLKNKTETFFTQYDYLKFINILLRPWFKHDKIKVIPCKKGVVKSHEPKEYGLTNHYNYEGWYNGK